MAGDTLLDFFQGLGSLGGDFLVHDDGYRVRRHTYAAVASAAASVAARLQRDGVSKGDAVLIWSENRPEWVVALWGCVLAGAIAVPIDYRSSAEFAARVRTIVGAKRVFVGDEVPARDDAPGGAWPEAWRRSCLSLERRAYLTSRRHRMRLIARQSVP